MLDPLAHEFAPHQDGYPELPSITLGREIDRWDANASLRNSLAHNIGLFAQAIAIALVSFAVLFGAGYWGLTRAEQHFQAEARI